MGCGRADEQPAVGRYGEDADGDLELIGAGAGRCDAPSGRRNIAARERTDGGRRPNALAKDQFRSASASLTTAIPDFRCALNSAFSFAGSHRSEEHTSELQSLMRISYAVFCLKKKNN